MSATTTATASASNITSDSPRLGRLRRFSQLRAYTQIHFPSHYSPSNGNTGRSHRNNISNRLSWFSPTSHSPTSPDSPTQTSQSQLGTSAPCPDSDQPALARYTSAPSRSSGNYQSSRAVELRPQASSSESSSRSNDSDGRTSGFIARLRRASTIQNRLSRVIDTSFNFVNAETTSSNAEVTSSNTEAINSNTEAASASGSEMRPTETASSTQNESAESLRRTTSANRSTPVKPNRAATIRFYPYHDPSHNSKPSLPFVPVTRTLPADSCVIRVGRYSERDGVPVPNPSEPSDAPVGFKSKVVSRKHCEFLYLNGQWHIKDVGSSSGTFLNHMRLSQPNMVSRLYAIKDGDIVQLGIDFRGGEEMIFRCVRIRIECNRSWQQQPNEFNKNTESLIRNLGKGDTADYAGCRECSICLGSVLRPYQCLFMAACAHVWHYKCISRLIHTPEYPMFQCPNCRAYTDLSAEVDDSPDYEDGAQKEAASESRQGASEEARSTADPPADTNHNSSNNNNSGNPANSDHTRNSSEEADLVSNVENMRLHDGNVSTDDTDHSNSPAPDSNDGVVHSPNIDIPASRNQSTSHRGRQSEAPSEVPEDNPMTPRNDSGPLVFDGRAGMFLSP